MWLLTDVMSLPTYKTLKLQEGPPGCINLQLARPSKSNAMVPEMWIELPKVFIRRLACGFILTSEGSRQCPLSGYFLGCVQALAWLDRCQDIKVVSTLRKPSL